MLTGVSDPILWPIQATDAEDLANEPVTQLDPNVHWMTAAMATPAWAVDADPGNADGGDEVFDGFGNTGTDTQSPELEIVKNLAGTARPGRHTRRTGKPDADADSGGRGSIVAMWKANLERPDNEDHHRARSAKEAADTEAANRALADSEAAKKTEAESSRLSTYEMQKRSEATAEDRAKRFLAGFK